jgi:hypothetical protein
MFPAWRQVLPCETDSDQLWKTLYVKGRVERRNDKPIKVRAESIALSVSFQKPPLLFVSLFVAEQRTRIQT